MGQALLAIEGKAALGLVALCLLLISMAMMLIGVIGFWLPQSKRQWLASRGAWVALLMMFVGGVGNALIEVVPEKQLAITWATTRFVIEVAAVFLVVYLYRYWKRQTPNV